MTPERLAQIQELFDAVRETPANRELLLAGVDPDIRSEIESLLDQRPDPIWGHPLPDPGPLASEAAAVTPIALGDRLGSYTVEAVLGEGGMGVVYRALDGKLNRPVAIKFLSDRLADAAGRRRFQREAQMASALNHPHIVTVYDAGDWEGRQYLVTELIDGGTLADWAKSAKRSWRQAVELLTGVADGLAAAHQAGILHRDIKPANILVTRSGYAKLADFGLAKLVEGSSAEAAPDPTDARTRPGMVLGTIAYMSPEQASGQTLDARSDVFSFGAVLYQLLTGQRPFTGLSDLEVLQKVIHETPQPLGEEYPVALRLAVEKALAKDPAERYQSMHEMVVDLRRSVRRGVETGPRVAAPRFRPFKWAWAALSMVVLIAGLWTWRTSRAPATEGVPAHFVVSPPEGTRIALRMPTKPLAAVAPDGQKLVLVAQDDAGVRSLWLRPLRSATYQRLDRTEGASLAFWSPDSRFIAFFADGKLKKIPVSGGSPQTICAVGEGDGEVATWSREGMILFSAPRKIPAVAPVGPLFRVSSAGGPVQPATVLDIQHGEVSHYWPQFLPDGRHFLYLARNQDPQKTRVYVQELGSTIRKTLLNSEMVASYAKGPSGSAYLLFPRDRVLLAQPLNLSRLELYGEPVAVATDVTYNTLSGIAAFSVSENGVLAYRAGAFGSSGTPIRRLAWYSREGRRLGDVGIAGAYQSIALSPDESRVAIARNLKLDDLQDWNVWILELASGIFSRLTPGPEFFSPVWSPDSRRIAAISVVGNRQQLVEISAESGATKVLFSDPEFKRLETWTPDGRDVLFLASVQPDQIPAAFRLPLSGEGKAQPILESDFYKGRFSVSPNGRWIAYQSTESGKYEIYIRSYPGLAEKRQVSNATGRQPLWRKDGQELFYLTLDGKLMAVPVKSGALLETGTPKLLFQTPIEGNPNLGQYAVTGDGQRFLIMEPAREGATSTLEQFHVELNWFAELDNKGSGRN